MIISVFSFDSMKKHITFVANVINVTCATKVWIIMSYGNLRLSKATITTLKDLHLAFEMAYLHQFSNDQFIQKMIDCIEDGDPAVWDAYLEIVSKREENH